MTQTIKLHHLVLGSAFVVCSAGISVGCMLDIDHLDAGFDDDGDNHASTDSEGDEGDAAECLLGTELDTVGVERKAWSPGCEVECDDGWGHDGEQIEIAWTSHVNSAAEPRAVGLLPDGRPVVALSHPQGVFINYFESDGLNIGGYGVPDIGSFVFAVEIDSNVIYVIHGDDDGTVVVSATNIGTQQELWRRSFPGKMATSIARGGGKLAFVLVTDDEQLEYELVVLDLDGDPQWTVPGTTIPHGVVFSPSAARLAVAGHTTRVYAADDGTLLDEHPFGGLAGALAFVDEDRLVTAGKTVDPVSDGRLVGNSLVGDDSWQAIYNRATFWCPELAEDEYSSMTLESFDAIARLSGGDLMAVGYEVYKHEGEFAGQPWVTRLSADGVLLGSDRGLWNGAAVDVVAGADGSAFVVFSNVVNEGPRTYTLRKYVP